MNRKSTRTIGIATVLLAVLGAKAISAQDKYTPASARWVSVL